MAAAGPTKQERHDALMAELAAMRQSIDALTRAVHGLRAPGLPQRPWQQVSPWTNPYPNGLPLPSVQIPVRSTGTPMNTAGVA